MEALFDFSIRTSTALVEWAFNGLCLGLLITGLVAVVLLRARKTNAATRYWIWWLTLAAVLLLPFFLSGAQIGKVEQSISERVLLPASEKTAQVKLTVSPPATDHLSSAPANEDLSLTALAPRLLPMTLVSLWGLLSILLILKLVRTYFRIIRIKKRSLPFGSPDIDSIRLPATLRISEEIQYPMAAGLGNPMILIPKQIVGALTKEELQAVILHETAHIARRDDWTQLMQKIVQAIFFMLPPVHWIGRQLDLERELACDDLVVEKTRMPGDYCRCLTRLMELTTMAGSSLVPAALTRRKQIVVRFKRILRNDSGCTVSFSRNRFVAAVGLLSATVLLSILAVPAVAVPLETVSFAELKACLETRPDEDAVEEEKSRIFVPPELADQLETLPESKIVDWSLQIYRLPVSFTLRSSDGEEEVATLWVNDKNKLRAVLRGSVLFTENDRSIENISSPGFLAVLDERGQDRLELEVRPGPLFAFYRNGELQAIDESTRNWMADIFLSLIRKSGVGAKERVARILRRQGVSGLLQDIETLEDRYVQVEYLTELIRSGKLIGRDIVKKVLDLIASLPGTRKADLLVDIYPLCRREGLGDAHDEAVQGLESRCDRQRITDTLK